MKFTQVAADAFTKLQLNAGIMLTEFDPTTGAFDRGDIFGATSGGVSFTASAEYLDFGEDIDNVPNNTMELKRLDTVTATMSGTFLTVDTSTAKTLIGAADVDASGKVTPRANLALTDFSDVWWVGDYSDTNTGDDAGFLAIRLINALSTGGFQIQSGDKSKGQFSFEFTGHYSMSDISVIPYELYVSGPDEAASTEVVLTSLSIGNLTLTPAFTSGTTSYTATTTNATNTISAVGTADITIAHGNTTVRNGGAITWDDGSNTVTITVTDGTTTKTYTVTVTKED